MSSCTHRAPSAFSPAASQPEALIERAVELDMPAIALADRNGLYGAARFHTTAAKSSVRAHIGAEIAVSSFGNRLTPAAWLPHQFPAEPPRIVLLSASQTGYQNLCQLITRFKMREATKAEGAATLEDLEEFSAGLICLTGGEEGPLAAALGVEEARTTRASLPIGSRRSMAAAICISNCSAISSAKRSAAIRRCSGLLPRFICPSSRPTASAMQRRRIARFSTSSPPFAITPRSTRLAGFSI